MAVRPERRRERDYEAAYAWLNHVLSPDAKWDAGEEESLRTQFADLLQQQGRYRELTDYLAGWIKRNPESPNPYARYLTTLVRSNQADQAETLAAQWLRDAQVDGELTAALIARLNAAIQFAVGQGYNLYSYRVEPKWHAPLAEAALFFARHDDRLWAVDMILRNSRFQSTDAGREAFRTLADNLLKDVDNMPVGRLIHYVDWTYYASLQPDEIKKLADALRRRWDAEKAPDAKHRLDQPLLQVLSYLGADETLAFRRVLYKDGRAAYREQYVREYFTVLLSQPWSPRMKTKPSLCSIRSPAQSRPGSDLRVRVAALHQLTDAMIAGRFQDRMKGIEHPEKLTRIDLRKKQDENRKLAREGFADRLRKEAAKHKKPFASWLTAERLWIDIILDRDLKQVVADCWALIDAPTAKVEVEDNGSRADRSLDEMLRDRCLISLMHLAARKGADPAWSERLLKYFDAQMTAQPDDGRWRSEKYRFLIALDRSKDLEKELRQWIAKSADDNRWRLALGYLLAEQGNVTEAIKLFETVEAADELTPGAYRSLADWYLAANRRAEHEKAWAQIYKTADEYRLSQMIAQSLYPWKIGGRNLPTQLDKEVLQVFKVLFEKSASPQGYLWQLQEFYQASRDFRLLSMLPDSVVGQSAGKVYGFLGGMRNVLNEVRDEAAADELVARIAKVRTTAKTTIDQRALDLLELLVERRAAEVQNQAGPHADKALAALQRAFKREWSPGEPMLMADFLAELGAISRPALAQEQLRQLEMLHRGAAPARSIGCTSPSGRRGDSPLCPWGGSNCASPDRPRRVREGQQGRPAWFREHCLDDARVVHDKRSALRSCGEGASHAASASRTQTAGILAHATSQRCVPGSLAEQRRSLPRQGCGALPRSGSEAARRHRFERSEPTLHVAESVNERLSHGSRAEDSGCRR